MKALLLGIVFVFVAALTIHGYVHAQPRPAIPQRVSGTVHLTPQQVIRLEELGGLGGRVATPAQQRAAGRRAQAGLYGRYSPAVLHELETPLQPHARIVVGRWNP